MELQKRNEQNTTTHYWGYRELSTEELLLVGGGEDGGDGGGCGDGGCDSNGCDSGGNGCDASSSADPSDAAHDAGLAMGMANAIDGNPGVGIGLG